MMSPEEVFPQEGRSEKSLASPLGGANHRPLPGDEPESQPCFGSGPRDGPTRRGSNVGYTYHINIAGQPRGS